MIAEQISLGVDPWPRYVGVESSQGEVTDRAALDRPLVTGIKLESEVSIQRPLVAALSRAHRKEQALCSRSIGTNSFLKITN